MHLEPSDDMDHHKNGRKQLKGTGMTATVIVMLRGAEYIHCTVSGGSSPRLN